MDEDAKDLAMRLARYFEGGKHTPGELADAINQRADYDFLSRMLWETTDQIDD